MSAAFQRTIKNRKELPPKEQALVVHSMTSSLETKQEQGVDGAWAALSRSRLHELNSGAVAGVSWQDIKDTVQSQNHKNHHTE